MGRWIILTTWIAHTNFDCILLKMVELLSAESSHNAAWFDNVESMDLVSENHI